MAGFVGRRSELDLLGRTLDGALGGRGSTVFITGDAGAGKSTLVARFLADAVERDPELRVIRAACSEQYGSGEPYQPFIDAFRSLLEDTAAPAGKRSLRELARELAPHWIAAIPVAGQVLAASLATASELRSAFGGQGAGSEEALFFQYTELFLTAARTQPILFFIDDLHWADRASVSLLTHLARKIDTERVMILGTYRAADVAAEDHALRGAKLELERYRAAQELVLRAMDEEALREMATLELGGPPSPDLMHWLVQHGGSNPLFFTELLKWLRDQNLAVEVRGEWRLSRQPQEIEIPRSAAGAIEKRLNRLDPDTYKVLEYASVEGNEFDSTTLARLLGQDELELEETLEPLARIHGLVRMTETKDLPNGDIASLYQFSHSLIQDVLHANLQGKRRILLHRKMAEILEDVYAAERGGIAHRLAVHYDEGRQAERAFEFAVMAADRASRVYAHYDALALIERALRNANEPARRMDALERLGDTKWVIGRYPDALEALEEAVREASAAGAPDRSLTLQRKSILVERDQGGRPAQELLDRMRSLADEAERLGLRAELCHILWHRIDLPGTEGDEDVALAGQALTIAQEIGDESLIARGHYFMGIALMMLGRTEESIEHFGRGLEAYEHLEDLSRVGRCHNCIAVANIMRGKYPDALQALDGASQAFAKVGNPMELASVRGNLGLLLTRTGEWERAEQNLNEALRMRRQIGAAARLLQPLEGLAELEMDRGELDRAEARWNEMLACARETGYWTAEVVAHCGIGRVRLERDDLAGAREAEAAAQASLKEGEAWNESLEAFQLLCARLAAEAGEVDGAVTMLEAGERELAARDRYMWGLYHLRKAEIVAKKDAERARDIAAEAVEAFAALGATPMQRRAAALAERLGGGPTTQALEA